MVMSTSNLWSAILLRSWSGPGAGSVGCARQGRYSFLRYTWACNLEREECAICGTMFRHTKKALIILLRESGAQTNVRTWAWLARSPGIMNIVGAEHDVKSRIHV